MKIKIVALALISLLLVACGKSEEEKKKAQVEAALEKTRAEQMANDIIQYQRFAVSEALSLMSGQKSFLAEIFSNNGVCFSSNDIEGLKKVLQPIADKSKYLNTINFKNDCTINVTFKDSDLAPDLKGETLSLKMTPDKGVFTWTCTFTGKNKNDVPNACK